MLGLIVGISGTLITMGVLRDNPSDIGKGLDILISASKNEDQSAAPLMIQTEESQQEVTFNYHELLLEGEQLLPELPPLPENEQADKPKQESPSSEPTRQSNEEVARSSSLYVLQVGSFQKFEDADRVKANLALNGIGSFIQKVTVEGRGDFYRVRVGPYEQIQELRKSGEALAKLGFHPLRFRLKKDI